MYLTTLLAAGAVCCAAAQDDASLAQYRAAELKHGRVAQLAFLGVLVQSAYQLPDPVFSQTKPLAALQQVYADRPEAIWQIIFAIGFLELTVFRQNPDNAPGDLGKSPLASSYRLTVSECETELALACVVDVRPGFGSAFKPKDDGKLAELQLKELKNGRLAMVGILGALYQESLTGQGPLEQLAAGHINPVSSSQGKRLPGLYAPLDIRSPF